MSADVLGSGLEFPVAIDVHGAVALAHDAQDVEQAIYIILSTAPGERPMRPEFGCDVHKLVFERISSATAARMARAVRSALHRWEPRIEVLEVSCDRSEEQLGRMSIEIAYKLRATNSRRNLIYPFYVVSAEE
jgi:uncharacterized protein